MTIDELIQAVTESNMDEGAKSEVIEILDEWALEDQEEREEIRRRNA